MLEGGEGESGVAQGASGPDQAAAMKENKDKLKQLKAEESHLKAEVDQLSHELEQAKAALEEEKQKRAHLYIYFNFLSKTFQLLANFSQTSRGPFLAVSTPTFASK